MIKNSTKSIYDLNIDGELVFDQGALSGHVVDHFKNFFAAHNRTIMDNQLVNCIPHLISQ